MIDFAAAWDALALGDEVTVTNGAPESVTGVDSVEHRAWRSHNFAGVVAEKIDGPPRALRIEYLNEAENLIGYLVCEGDGHAFAPSQPSPQLARDMRWEEAKAYRTQRQNLPVPIPGVVEGQIVIADGDPKSREIIEALARGAMAALMSATPLELTFTAFDNHRFTVNAEQILAIGNAVLLYQTLCHGASQAVRDALDAALAADASAEDIFAIDITAGYPA